MSTQQHLNTPALVNIAKAIKLLILDVDGVLTDGKIYLSTSGESTTAFHIHDGLGLKRLQEIGITIAIISGRDNEAARIRLTSLGIKHIFLGENDKANRYLKLKETLNIAANQTAYAGDDLPDIPVMAQVGLPIAVNNAVSSVKAIAKWETTLPGGQGAVREICDFIYSAKQP